MKKRILEWFFGPPTLIQQVMINNMERALRHEHKRVKVAVDGLNQIIANTARAEWVPGGEQLVMETVVTAENTLHEMRHSENY